MGLRRSGRASRIMKQKPSLKGEEEFPMWGREWHSRQRKWREAQRHVWCTLQSPVVLEHKAGPEGKGQASDKGRLGVNRGWCVECQAVGLLKALQVGPVSPWFC